MSWKDDLNYGLAAFGVQIPDSLPIDSLSDKLAGRPLRNTAAIVAASAVVFYIAERDYNPKVNDLFDAMTYCSTCLSVGYGDIFAKTPVGKLIGTTLMTLGPALSSSALDGPQEESLERVQEEILITLRQILDRLPPATQAAGEATANA